MQYENSNIYLKIIETQKGLITRKTGVKYQSSSTHCLKVISMVKVLKKWVKLQGQGHRVKNNDTHWKVLGQHDRMTEWQTGQKQYAQYLGA